jgi:hypothetical protein
MFGKSVFATFERPLETARQKEFWSQAANSVQARSSRSAARMLLPFASFACRFVIFKDWYRGNRNGSSILAGSGRGLYVAESGLMTTRFDKTKPILVNDDLFRLLARPGRVLRRSHRWVGRLAQ